MKKLLALFIVFVGINYLLPANAEMGDKAKQEVKASKSGGIFLKAQRQEKAKDSTQSVNINKSGGIVVVIQRNISCKKVEKEESAEK